MIVAVVQVMIDAYLVLGSVSCLVCRLCMNVEMKNPTLETSDSIQAASSKLTE